MKKLSFLMIVLSLLVTLSCGDDDSGNSNDNNTTGDGKNTETTDSKLNGSCTTKMNNAAVTCQQYGNYSEESLKSIKAACQNSAVWSDKSCATDNLLGKCTIEAAGMTVATYYYKTQGVTAATLKSACESSKGKWE